ncbi:hypothetical protein N5O88_10250 [Pseudomonas sp. GD03721]|nr:MULTISPECIES: hypothetical protein [unclassified Pseudomonas]MDH1440353.1 hypothetical protein [Pseudomonas sp. GD03722]WGG03557.1 hypothetical protein N5O88_10250 [Pseudomonas sp. GD03721]WGG07725.1 hypothetical protein N5O87_10260 [Pseudomonas sp. GD03919]
MHAHHNPLAKVYYRPIEAALRWCNLIAYEEQILEKSRDCPLLLSRAFPQWPCLHANTDRIFDAVRNHELPYGCLGISVPLGTEVDCTLLTVRHTDLKQWMSCHYPDQRPAFLFERSPELFSELSIGTYLALQADRDALQLQVKSIQTIHQELLDELQATGLERESLKTLLKSQGKLSNRSEEVYLHIIGALLKLLLGHSPSGKPHSVFRSQSAIVSALIAHHENVPGITKRTLDEKFAAAKRSLSEP